MWCLTDDESRRWCQGRGINLEASGHPVMDAAACSVSAPLHGMNWSLLTWLSQFIARSVEPFDQCLMWVTTWGVWPSSENLHLFYRLREGYGERRPLHEAPGHLFLTHEGADLATFVQLGLLFGWDFYLVPGPNYATAFVSHDEFLEFRTDDLATAQKVAASLDGATIERKSGEES